MFLVHFILRNRRRGATPFFMLPRGSPPSSGISLTTSSPSPYSPAAFTHLFGRPTLFLSTGKRNNASFGAKYFISPPSDRNLLSHPAFPLDGSSYSLPSSQDPSVSCKGTFLPSKSATYASPYCNNKFSLHNLLYRVYPSFYIIIQFTCELYYQHSTLKSRLGNTSILWILFISHHNYRHILCFHRSYLRSNNPFCPSNSIFNVCP